MPGTRPGMTSSLPGRSRTTAFAVPPNPRLKTPCRPFHLQTILTIKNQSQPASSRSPAARTAGVCHDGFLGNVYFERERRRCGIELIRGLDIELDQFSEPAGQ
jgi:hypothetical protein